MLLFIDASILLLHLIIRRSILVDAFSLPRPATLRVNRITSSNYKLHSFPSGVQRLGIHTSDGDAQEDSVGFVDSGESPPGGDTGNKKKDVGDSDDYDEYDDKSKPVPISKAKWKNKRYMMMQDVMELIKNGDSHAPRKAEETVERMMRLSELHQDENLRPNEQVYNVSQSNNPICQGIHKMLETG